MKSKKVVNKDFFKNWSSEMAYVLGFFAADGYMWESARGAYFFGFQIKDKNLLYKIRKILNSNHKIAQRISKNSNWHDSYRLQIGSKEMFNDLLMLGMTPAKSKTLTFPKIPKEYLKDFIRGYFDGDGNVYFKKHFAKDRGKDRWVFQTRFTSASRRFLKEIQERLKKKYIQGGYIYQKQRGYELVFSHRDSIALYELMYNNTATSLYLRRKKDIFEKALRTLYHKGT